MGTAGNDATRALDQAKQLTSEGQYGEAVYYFTNALSHAPGDMGVIDAYRQAVLETLAVATQADGDADERMQQLDWLEAFLLDQTAQVSCENVPALLAQVQDVHKRRAALQQAAPVQVDPETEAMAGRLTKLQKGKLKLSIPTKVEALQERIELLTALKDYAVTDGGLSNDDEAVAKLETHLGQLNDILRFELLRQEVEALLDLASKQASTDSAAYTLQLCESNIREVVVLGHRVDKKRKSAGAALVEKLRATSDGIAERSRKESSKAAWAELQGTIEKPLTEAKKWRPPSKGSANRSCQSQLERVEQLSRQLSKGYPRLSHPDYQAKAEQQMEVVQSLAATAGQEQQKSYNAWAMKQIRLGYENGEDETGAFGDEEKLGALMVQFLGGIDTRYLTADVQRCYTEVFEYLFKGLKGPKNKQDFKTKGRKLKVLSDIFEKLKKTPADF
jgi:hypothetical protein